MADRTEEFPRSTSNPSELTRAARSANGCRRGKKEGKKKGEKRKGDGGGGKMPEGRMARQPDGAGERAAGLREEDGVEGRVGDSDFCQEALVVVQLSSSPRDSRATTEGERS